MKTLRLLPSLAALRDAGRRWLRRERPPPPPVDPFAAPTDLRFVWGRFPFPRVVSYRIRKGWIERSVRHHSPTRTDPAVRRQPTPEEWREFWQTIAPLRIWDWQPDYFTPPPSFPFVIDGKSWRFSCRCGLRWMKSQGSAYGPKLSRPHETDSRSDSLSLLAEALDALLESEDVVGQPGPHRFRAARARPGSAPDQ